MKIEKTIYSLCLVTFSDDELFGEKSFQMYNKELQSLNFPHIINVFFFRRCHLLFNAWLHGLMAGTFKV